MRRQPKTLADQTFDVLVIGGGIQGISIFHELARSGFNTALIEADDFAAGTSAYSLKVIHGGLRYLQSADLPRMRRSIRARRGFMQLAPDYIKPQGFLIPTSGLGPQHPWAMRIAFWVNDLISADRNSGLPQSSWLPRGKVMTAKALRGVFQGNDAAFATGGAAWYDGFIHDVGRVAIEMVKSGYASGGSPCNYVRADRYLIEDGIITGVAATDTESQSELTIQASLVIEAAGTARPNLRASMTSDPRADDQRWLKAVNLVLKRELSVDYAIGLKAKQPTEEESRYFFFAPYRGHTLFGTFYFSLPDREAPPAATAEEIRLMLAHAQSLGPDLELSADDVSMIHTGVIPATSLGPNRRLVIKTSPAIRSGTGSVGVENLIEVQSVKYTESLDVASQVAQQAARYLKREYRYSDPESLPASELTSALTPKAVAERAVHDEMAVHLTDLILRRTSLGELYVPQERELQPYLDAMAAAASWDEAKIESELERLKGHYQAMGWSARATRNL